MKTMTCRQLGGACDVEFTAETFEEMAALSKKHGMEMLQSKDPDHLAAMEKLQSMMQTQEQMNEWVLSKKREFDALPES